MTQIDESTSNYSMRGSMVLTVGADIANTWTASYASVVLTGE